MIVNFELQGGGAQNGITYQTSRAFLLGQKPVVRPIPVQRLPHSKHLQVLGSGGLPYSVGNSPLKDTSLIRDWAKIDGS